MFHHCKYSSSHDRTNDDGNDDDRDRGDKSAISYTNLNTNAGGKHNNVIDKSNGRRKGNRRNNSLNDHKHNHRYGKSRGTGNNGNRRLIWVATTSWPALLYRIVCYIVKANFLNENVVQNIYIGPWQSFRWWRSFQESICIALSYSDHRRP